MSARRLSLLALLLLVFALSLLRLGAQSLWYDEGVTAWVAQKPVGDLVSWTAADIQPPLYYLVVRFGGWMWGWSEWALRFPSAFATVIAAALMARLATLLRPRGNDFRRETDWTPLVAAGLLGLHPLVLYYAQEARMYSLLLGLCLAAAVALAPAMRAQLPKRGPLWLAFWGTLALYTHYFAGFVLVALLFGWLARGRLGQRQSQSWRGVPFAYALMALAYAPWAVVMVRRLGDDRSYWQGRLKVGEALAETAARFVAGETSPEQIAIGLSALVLVVTAVSVVWLWRRAPERRGELGLALVWLLVPVAAVMALASFAPKFNVRYVFAALPGLVLLWAWPLGDLLSGATSGRRRASALAAMLLLVGIFGWSTANWHTQVRYAKAQWREVTEFLRPRLAPEERIVLVSGHAWPVWNYYAPDLPVVRLPAIDVLDVDQVLTFASTGAALRSAIPDEGGAWLVGWQDEVVDPNGVVPVQLELGGREKGSSARFQHLTLRRWSRIRLDRLADAAPVTEQVGADFGGAVTLVGYHGLDNGDLLLFWRPGPALGAQDLQVAITVEDGSGRIVATPPGRRLGGYTLPTARWQADEIVMGQVPAADWLGASPAAGTYTVTLRVYDGNDAGAAPLRVGESDALRLENVTAVFE